MMELLPRAARGLLFLLMALLWAVPFMIVGAMLALPAGGVMLADAGLWSHRAAPAVSQALLHFVGLGAIDALPVWLICLCFARLPGAQAVPGRDGWLGLGGGLGALLGAGGAMTGFAALPMLLALTLAVPGALHGHPVHLPGLTGAAGFGLLAGELGAAWWLGWLLRQMPPGLRHGGVRGVAWNAAKLPAYGWALALGVLLALGARLLLRELPPSPHALAQMSAPALPGNAALAGLTFFLALAVLAPVVEEIAFRGIAFAGIAQRFGSTTAVILTTLMFTALHAPEKLHYLPGFADVTAAALAACWLRLRYCSIRPAILLHLCYNSVLFLGAALLR